MVTEFKDTNEQPKKNIFIKWALRILVLCGLVTISTAAFSIYATTEIFLPRYAQLADADSKQKSVLQINWSRLPFYRRAVGSLLLSIGSPNWLGQYVDLVKASR